MQPTPKPNDTQPIHEQVIEDIKRRAEVGKQNYGTYLQANNGRDSLVDAYEEAQDLALYLKQAILERDAERDELAAQTLEAWAWMAEQPMHLEKRGDKWQILGRGAAGALIYYYADTPLGAVLAAMEGEK